MRKAGHARDDDVQPGGICRLSQGQNRSLGRGDPRQGDQKAS